MKKRKTKITQTKAKAAAKGKAKEMKKKKGEKGDDDDEDDEDYDPYNALSKMWKSDLPKPSAGSFENCARCQKQFTVVRVLQCPLRFSCSSERISL